MGVLGRMTRKEVVRMVVPWWAQGLDLHISEQGQEHNMDYRRNCRGQEAGDKESKDSSGSDIINSQGYLSLEDWSQDDNHKEAINEEKRNLREKSQEEKSQGNSFPKTLLCRRVLPEPRQIGKYVSS